jgi:hypothetical protein
LTVVAGRVYKCESINQYATTPSLTNFHPLSPGKNKNCCPIVFHRSKIETKKNKKNFQNFIFWENRVKDDFIQKKIGKR